MIIWMNDIKSRRFVSPSLDIHSQILEVHTIGVKRSSIGLKYADLLRRKVKDLLEFSLCPEPGFCLALLAEVCNGSHKFEVAGANPAMGVQLHGHA
jgi:hypothetical protein